MTKSLDRWEGFPLGYPQSPTLLDQPGKHGREESDQLPVKNQVRMAISTARPPESALFLFMYKCVLRFWFETLVPFNIFRFFCYVFAHLRENKTCLQGERLCLLLCAMSPVVEDTLRCGYRHSSTQHAEFSGKIVPSSSEVRPRFFLVSAVESVVRLV